MLAIFGHDNSSWKPRKAYPSLGFAQNFMLTERLPARNYKELAFLCE
jgi:hypothetical protein